MSVTAAVRRTAEFTLPWRQEIRAATVGFLRRQNAVEQQLRPRHATGSRWGGDIEGACAELAAALFYAVRWTGEAVWKHPPAERQPDIGERTEVRWSMGAFLNFDAKRDRDDWRYVAVSGYAPTFVIHGWIEGTDCRREEWLHHYPERDVYRVPLSALKVEDDGRF